ncbi:hypothetical protein TNCV_1421681 [Trichonephila clavipes]|nr:hypothetical protein TNCV_1421681 [Trichonephila clavipes]
MTESRYQSQNAGRHIFSVRVCEVVIRELAHADDMVLPGKVRGELRDERCGSFACVSPQSSTTTRQSPGTLQALRDLVRKFTGCTCNKTATVSEDVVMEVHHTVTAGHTETAKRHSARIGYSNSTVRKLLRSVLHVSLSVQARPDVGAG